MPDREDAVLSALLLAVFLGAAWLALDYPAASRRFPLLVALPGVALCAVQLRRDLRPTAAGVAPEVAAALRAPLAAELALVAWFVGFVAAALALGVVLGGALATFAFLRWRAGESVRVAAAWSAGAAGSVHLVFERLLGSVFFEGLLVEWLRGAA
jgi:hypothetical protein